MGKSVTYLELWLRCDVRNSGAKLSSSCYDLILLHMKIIYNFKKLPYLKSLDDFSSFLRFFFTKHKKNTNTY